MFRRIWPEPEPSVLDPVIESLISEMAGYEGHSEEYAKCAYILKTLVEAKAEEPKRDRVSANTMAVIAANLTGIVMIIMSERIQVISTKALNFVLRPKS